tara:strand:- start:3613 stop:4713 length:1101 start_codon:yes stop_codon:yes gene_type:complete
MASKSKQIVKYSPAREQAEEEKREAYETDEEFAELGYYGQYDSIVPTLEVELGFILTPYGSAAPDRTVYAPDETRDADDVNDAIDELYAIYSGNDKDASPWHVRNYEPTDYYFSQRTGYSMYNDYEIELLYKDPISGEFYYVTEDQFFEWAFKNRETTRHGWYTDIEFRAATGYPPFQSILKYKYLEAPERVKETIIFYDRQTRKYAVSGTYQSFDSKEEALKFLNRLGEGETYTNPFDWNYIRGQENTNYKGWWQARPKNKNALPSKTFIPTGYEQGRDDIYYSPKSPEGDFWREGKRAPIFAGQADYDWWRSRSSAQSPYADPSIVTRAGEYESEVPWYYPEHQWTASARPRFVSPVGTMRSYR